MPKKTPPRLRSHPDRVAVPRISHGGKTVNAAKYLRKVVYGGISQQAFADQVELSISAIQKAEQGRKAGLKVLMNLAVYSPPPLCWKFLEAADLTRKDIDRMLAGKVARTPKKKT